MPEEELPRTKGGITYTPGFIAKASYQSVQTVYRHLEEGMFPNAWKVGKRKWLITKDDAEAYLGFDPETVQIEVKR